MKHNVIDDPLLTVADLARLLGCGRTMAWALVNSGQIPTIRVGRLVRIARTDVTEFLRSHRS